MAGAGLQTSLGFAPYECAMFRFRCGYHTYLLYPPFSLHTNDGLPVSPAFSAMVLAGTPNNRMPTTDDVRTDRQRRIQNEKAGGGAMESIIFLDDK